jgi:NAD(P)H-hydrate epimerase
MKLFTTKQIAVLDRFTIENEPIAGIDLMERAALQITNWLVQKFSAERKLLFFAGSGNNGGDTLAIARQMASLDFLCEVHLLNIGKSMTESAATNLDRLQKQGKVKISTLNSAAEFPETNPADIFIDGLFGSGLTRPIDGVAAALVQKINSLPNTVVAIDIPSGLSGENGAGCNEKNTVQASYTLTFQFPKLSFLFPENEQFTGNWEVLPIRLHPEGIEKTPTEFYWIDKNMVQPLIPSRSRFGHKGTYGHALLIAGSYGKMGAAILAAKSCLRAGAGLLTTHVPHLGYPIIQTAVPEAMASVDQHDSNFTEFPDLSSFSVVGAGPGIGQKTNTKRALIELLKQVKVPLALDADALNILSENKEWLSSIPENSILTPHPGEFKRLAGESVNSWERLQNQITFSKKYKVVIVLKGAFTSVSMPDGRVFFNSTGNPGMATAGSGDVLTGIITGLLSQCLSPENAAIAGVCLHGLAGDFAASEKSENAIVASDIVENLGKAFLDINQTLEK